MTDLRLDDAQAAQLVRRRWYSHDGAGLPLADEPPGLRCAKAPGGECRRPLHLR